MKRPKKKTKLTTILIAVCGAMALVTLAVAAVIVFTVWKKSDEYLERPEMLEVAQTLDSSPDLEIAGIDPDKGTMTIRHKETKETLTLGPEDVKDVKDLDLILEGKFASPEHKAATDAENGDNENAANQWHENAPIPEEVVVYPAAPVRSRDHGESEREAGIIEQETSDHPSVVQNAMENLLKNAGYKIISTKDKDDGILIHAENTAKKWAMDVLFAESKGGGTKIFIEYRQL